MVTTALIATTTLAADELHVLADHAQTGALLASRFVVPLVELQTALDKDRAAFGEVLSGQLGLTPPQGDVDVGDFLNSLAIVTGANPVYRHAKVTNRSSLGSVTDFEIPGDIPEKHDFVDVGHGGWRALKFRQDADSAEGALRCSRSGAPELWR